MSGPAATVLIPTFDHGALARLALASALAQTVDAIEVFLVGDGVPNATRELAAGLIAGDKRLRFFDNPKGPRNGEVHRHTALAEARGRVVLYLADDDLWLPDHVESMLGVLEDADFATAVALQVSLEGELASKGADFGRPEIRASFLRGGVGITLSALGHTLSAYRRLPEGWSTTPDGIPTDRHLWVKFVSDPAFRGAGASKATVLTLPSSARVQMSPEQRDAELSRWWKQVADPQGRAEIHVAAFSSAHKRAALLAAKLDKSQSRYEKLRRRTAALEASRALRLEAKIERALGRLSRRRRSRR